MKLPRAATAALSTLTAVVLAGSLAACSSASGDTAETAAGASTASAGATGSETDAADVSLDDLGADTHFSESDLEWDEADVVDVSLADGASSGGEGVEVVGDAVTITAAGVYRLSGTLVDGTVNVAAGEEDDVVLILDGVDIASGIGSPLTATTADEVTVYLAEGSGNRLVDAVDYAETDLPTATIAAATDLTIAGPGSLELTGNANDAINTKDGLVLAGGNVSIAAVDDGIRGKDYVAVTGGTWQISAADDGLKSDDEEDADRGWVLVGGGALEIDAGDDGVKAVNTVRVAGGAVTVTGSYEGIEAAHVLIESGDVDVTSSDDGINAAGASAEASAGGMGGQGSGDYTVEISGGEVTIDAEGDGLDSNGTASISGGTVVINGPESNGNGALDVDGELDVSGGTVVAAGSAGMAVTPSAASEQSSIQLTADSALPAGTVIQVVDADEELLTTFVTAKEAQSIVLSTEGMTDGAEYTVYTGGAADGAGLTEGSLDGAAEYAVLTGGEYTAGQMGGMGGRQRP
ncbi:carbohydrate-binding domain-containing protein [Zhihengliuella halotolerans]|uniref:Uncharacterized protein DUF4353 n=1 Tax=Zhihengliuella halotolerans TaxID=370736 RepID=A0A4Q8AH32_9MICC|nr:carbohydrate-binding domain-containing protein [Zhihengliuella halotolerans]RZU63700.1 uncharacterized protein DUF4353 [Zhihengliuella halotolerans]